MFAYGPSKRLKSFQETVDNFYHIYFTNFGMASFDELEKYFQFDWAFVNCVWQNSSLQARQLYHLSMSTIFVPIAKPAFSLHFQVVCYTKGKISSHRTCISYRSQIIHNFVAILDCYRNELQSSCTTVEKRTTSPSKKQSNYSETDLYISQKCSIYPEPNSYTSKLPL